jgi:hypothetical protein
VAREGDKAVCDAPYPYAVGTQVQRPQMHEAVEALNLAQLVLRDVEFLQQRAALQRHQGPDGVEREVEDRQVAELLHSTDAFNLVVVQFQLAQRRQAFHTIHVRDQARPQDQVLPKPRWGRASSSSGAKSRL